MAKAPRSLAGKVVAITGGARGIGRATAAALIAQGARVAIGDIDAPLAEQTASGAGRRHDRAAARRHRPRRASTPSSPRSRTASGPLDVLINNAGIMPIGPFVDETDATATRMIDINLHGVIYGSKLALERFLPRGRGHLVNIASVAGKAGFPGGATYCATKHAVVGLSEAIRAEVRTTDIDVSIVMPVVVNTELGSGLQRSRGRQGGRARGRRQRDRRGAADRPRRRLRAQAGPGLFRFMNVVPPGRSPTSSPRCSRATRCWSTPTTCCARPTRSAPATRPSSPRAAGGAGGRAGGAQAAEREAAAPEPEKETV